MHKLQSVHYTYITSEETLVRTFPVGYGTKKKRKRERMKNLITFVQDIDFIMSAIKYYAFYVFIYFFWGVISFEDNFKRP